MTKKCPKCRLDMRYEEAEPNSFSSPSGGEIMSSSSAVVMPGSSGYKKSSGCWRCDNCGYIRLSE